MRVSKSKAYVYSLVSILIVFSIAIFFGAGEEGAVSATLTAIVALTTAFIAGNVTDNGVKGKYFNEGLKEK